MEPQAAFSFFSSALHFFRRTRTIRVALTALILLHATGAAHAYTITTSIRPLYGIAKAVGGDVVDVTLLLDTRTSPHDATLKPSQVLKISQADTVLIVNRHFESFLDKPIETYGSDRVLEASAMPGVQLLSRRDWAQGEGSGEWYKKLKERQAQPELDEHDYHLWLDPDKAVAIAGQVRDLLIRKLPQGEEYFTSNYEAFRAEVMQADQEVRQALLPLASRSFVSFHDSYQYFTRRYALRQAAVIGESTAQEIGPQRLEWMQKLIAEQNVACILKDPEHSPRSVKALSELTGKPLAEADPLGMDLPLDGSLYPALLRSMGSAFVDCLKS